MTDTENQPQTKEKAAVALSQLVRRLGDFDVWYLPCDRCGYDTAKSSKADVKYCWKCGNRVYRDFTDRALKSAPNSVICGEELRADRDLEKKLRKDAEHALCDASELLEEIMRGKVNPEDEAEKWLRAYDPIRLNRRTDETPTAELRDAANEDSK